MSTAVLYVHGLESGPRGRKARTLERAGFAVVAGQMPCGRSAVLRDPVVLALLACAVVGVVAAAILRGASGLLVAVAALFVLTVVARPLLIRRMFRRSVDVQLALLARHPIDVVVGSSFGGAVGLELLSRGAWKGPTVLLCPAHRLIADRGWMVAPALPPDAPQVVVVHGRRDETVPIEHSRALVRGTRSRLIEVDDDHRLSASTTPENLATWVAKARDPVPQGLHPPTHVA
jgi:pimeloyl-ACP methyl ester carboxylesterase